MRAIAVALLVVTASGCAPINHRNPSNQLVPDIAVALAGSWVLSSDGTEDHAEGWQRTPRQVVQPRFAEPHPTPGSPDEDPNLANRRYLIEQRTAEDRWAAANRNRDESYFSIAARLHRAASSIEIDVRSNAVALTTDGERVRFTTSGVKEALAINSQYLDVKSWWEGNTLHQELTNRHGVKITQLFRASADSQTMWVETAVLAPSFKPPLATTRTYRRSK